MSPSNGGDLKWLVPCIVLVPLVYTYLISRLTISVSHTPQLPSTPTPERINQARQRRQALQQLETKKRHLSRKPFPLLKLPVELRILVVQHCASSPETFSSLLLVSRHVQHLAYTSCLPLLPIRLIDEHQIMSFSLFLEQKPSLSGLVHHLWVTPLQEPCVTTAVGIVKRCTNLTSLACTGRMLQDSVTSAFRGYRLHHTRLRELTLLYTSDANWANILHSQSTISFFQRLTHLRLVGDRVPAGIKFPNLVQISFAYNAMQTLGHELLEDKEAYPRLQSVALVRERTHLGSSVRIWRKPNPDPAHTDKNVVSNVFVYEIPAQWTELNMWCDNALGKGFWQLCAAT
ncbi:hypothetical protein CC1G_05025 [Coprinopsis cinerea okayama7|uniref:F-box domain-containing protein n=1 Tax=Coprinopsis cinerea (strain Okayama-7 / 130 / ATCC MYA-4618 / FGSC 9003) TaxID=240176 RepID=A8NSK5_COPC7|nr:hypothetical protein CC1G_05025 [Coprinopsis cinerea okayama7\|eukprot:XP_001836032.1 hypothetical protein CC1G_05025 [Coprinopsis cinerea okayama7\